MHSVHKGWSIEDFADSSWYKFASWVIRGVNGAVLLAALSSLLAMSFDGAVKTAAPGVVVVAAEADATGDCATDGGRAASDCATWSSTTNDSAGPAGPPNGLLTCTRVTVRACGVALGCADVWGAD